MATKEKAPPTFIVDCPDCKAKVAAIESGRAEQFYMDDNGEPYGMKVVVGNCPKCELILVGQKSGER